MPARQSVRPVFTLQQWWPTVVFTCNCVPSAPGVDPQVLALPSMHHTADCARCGRRYRIDLFHYDRKADAITVELGILPPSITQADATAPAARMVVT